MAREFGAAPGRSAFECGPLLFPPHPTRVITATKRSLKVEESSVTMPVRIRLKGKWLEAAGFKAGTRVEVTVEPGRLTIETKP